MSTRSINSISRKTRIRFATGAWLIGTISAILCGFAIKTYVSADEANIVTASFVFALGPPALGLLLYNFSQEGQEHKGEQRLEVVLASILLAFAGAVLFSHLNFLQIRHAFFDVGKWACLSVGAGVMAALPGGILFAFRSFREEQLSKNNQRIF